jgi:hypothetical protein
VQPKWLDFIRPKTINYFTFNLGPTGPVDFYDLNGSYLALPLLLGSR